MLFILSVASVVAVIASAFFAAILDGRHVPFFHDNVVGRTLNVLGHAPLVLTIGFTIALAIPFSSILSFLKQDPEEGIRVWVDYTEGLGMIWDWFFHGVPDFIVHGR